MCPDCVQVTSSGDVATCTGKKKRGRPRKIQPSLELSQTDCESESSPSSTLSKTDVKERQHVKRMKKCPTLGCDGQGHMTGRFEMHHTISGCPKYHNMTPQECKVCIELKIAQSILETLTVKLFVILFQLIAEIKGEKNF